MRVRLKVAATVPIVWGDKTVRHDWMPAGSEVDLPEEDFSPDVHEKLVTESAAPKRIAPVGK
jgi:hypothetical protein